MSVYQNGGPRFGWYLKRDSKKAPNIGLPRTDSYFVASSLSQGLTLQGEHPLICPIPNMGAAFSEGCTFIGFFACAKRNQRFPYFATDPIMASCHMLFSCVSGGECWWSWSGCSCIAHVFKVLDASKGPSGRSVAEMELTFDTCFVSPSAVQVSASQMST